MLDTGATYGPWGLAPANDAWGHIGVDLVNHAGGEEGSVHLAPAFDEHAEDAPRAELIHERPQGHPAIRRRGKSHDLRCPHATRSGCGDQSIWSDDSRRH